MSPISPLTSVEGHHGPSSVGTTGFHNPGSQQGGISSPASVSSNAAGGGNPASNSAASNSNSYLNKSLGSVAPADKVLPPDSPEANSLVLNLVLSDTLLNLQRDHNFNSCTICVCSNEGNIRGRDASVYLPPDFAGDEDVNCTCGYSAVVNRRLAHQSGLFYEDETEVTSIQDDLYYRKKPSLLLLDPKYGTDGSSVQALNEKSNLVDTISGPLLELIHFQSAVPASPHSALVKYSSQYLKKSQMIQAANGEASMISMVELMDANEVIFDTLQHLKSNRSSSSSSSESTPGASTASSSTGNNHNKLDESLKSGCFHKWPLLPAKGPLCSEDIIRVMRSLQPVLNVAIHMANKKKDSSNKKGGGGTSGSLSVEGPLTWRQFHRMAGPATKGHTDDQCEPLPVPNITVGHEKDFMSLSPLSVNFWETLSLEPYSTPRDVVYLVISPDNDFLVGNARSFFRNLSMVYEVCT